ncbi:MAG: hypothetical protein ACXWP4_01220 [Polyangiales bacterium]
MVRGFIFASALVVSALVSTVASANERRFTYTYESAVMPNGVRELEVWTTHRSGRDHPWSQFDHRFEFEVGLGRGFMTAFYVNASATGETLSDGTRQSTFEYEGFSNEWKWKLLDPVADPIGLALYGELRIAPKETELETKILLDKRIGGFLLAFNAVGEMEWEHGTKAGETEQEAELKYESDLAFAYLLPGGFAAGLEARHALKFEEEETKYSVLYAGPVLSYAAETWWVAATAMRQLRAFKGATDGAYNYDDNEKLNFRLIFSFHL